MQATPIRADQLAHVLQTLDQDYKALAGVYRSPMSEETRAKARQVLSESVNKAQQTVERCRGVQDPELRGLVSKLTIQADLAADSLKHPELLRR